MRNRPIILLANRAMLSGLKAADIFSRIARCNCHPTIMLNSRDSLSATNFRLSGIYATDVTVDNPYARVYFVIRSDSSERHSPMDLMYEITVI